MQLPSPPHPGPWLLLCHYPSTCSRNTLLLCLLSLSPWSPHSCQQSSRNTHPLSLPAYPRVVQARCSLARSLINECVPFPHPVFPVAGVLCVPFTPVFLERARPDGLVSSSSSSVSAVGRPLQEWRLPRGALPLGCAVSASRTCLWPRTAAGVCVELSAHLPAQCPAHGPGTMLPKGRTPQRASFCARE